MKSLAITALTTLLLTAGPFGAAADEFPSRAVRIIIPYAAGGSSDTGTRLVQESFSRELGQPVVIENRGGGGGLNATDAYFKSDHDAHTLLLGGIAPLTIIPNLRSVSYVPERDFVPIGTVWRSAQTLVVRPGLGVKTVAEFLAHAKANPGKVTIASAGLATVAHLAAELLEREAGIDLINVHFRSTGDTLPQILSGQIDGLFGDASLVAPHVKAGTVVAIAVAAPHRSPALPETPTFGEAGYPTVEAEGWHGLGVLAKTPAAHVKRLRDALSKAQASPDYQSRLKNQGGSAGEPGPEAMSKLIRTDSAKWGVIVKAANIKMN